MGAIVAADTSFMLLVGEAAFAATAAFRGVLGLEASAAAAADTGSALRAVAKPPRAGASTTFAAAPAAAGTGAAARGSVADRAGGTGTLGPLAAVAVRAAFAGRGALAASAPASGLPASIRSELIAGTAGPAGLAAGPEIAGSARTAAELSPSGRPSASRETAYGHRLRLPRRLRRRRLPGATVESAGLGRAATGGSSPSGPKIHLRTAKVPAIWAARGAVRVQVGDQCSIRRPDDKRVTSFAPRWRRFATTNRREAAGRDVAVAGTPIRGGSFDQNKRRRASP